MQNTQHFLISRTDNIGDVVLTLPLVILLKRKFPHARISFLARDYVAPVVKHCIEIDKFISWDALDKLPNADAIEQIKGIHATTILHVFPRKKIAMLAKQAKIPTRIGTSRRLYHLLTCNKRVRFSRSRSPLHEAQLNLKLLKALGMKTDYPLSELTHLNFLSTPLQQQERIDAIIDNNKFNLVIHPLSNGNGREWPIDYFKTLINSLPDEKFNLLITGSPAEKERLKALLVGARPNVIDLSGCLSLDELLYLLSTCDGVLANSTGPLHMAAALGTKTLGLFPPAKLMCPQRWGPLGSDAKVLMHDNPCSATQCHNNDCLCMRAISVDSVRNALLEWL